MNPRIICQHVAEDPRMALHGDKKSNRVCCPACHRKGFLSKGFLSKIFTIVGKDGKLIGTIRKGKK